MTPRQFHRYVRAYRDRSEAHRRDRWQQAATLASFVYNFGGMRDKKFKGKRPDQLFPDLFDKRPGTIAITKEAAADLWARWNKQIGKT